MRRTTSLLLATGLVFAVGCGTAGTPTAMPTPTPLDIALQAGETMLATNSLHFVIDIAGDLVYLDEGLNHPPIFVLKHAEGDLVRPDLVRAIVRITSFGLTSEVGIIGLGPEQYATNPASQQWERLPPGQGWYFDPTLLFDPNHGIEAILRETEWGFGTGEDIEGQAHYHLQGRTQGAQISPLTSGLVCPGEVIMDVWVGWRDTYVRRIEIVELESDPEDPTHWVIQLSAFDEPVEIEAPPTAP